MMLKMTKKNRGKFQTQTFQNETILSHFSHQTSVVQSTTGANISNGGLKRERRLKRVKGTLQHKHYKPKPF